MLSLAPHPTLDTPVLPPSHGPEHSVVHPFLLTTSVHEPDRPLSWPPHHHPEHELLWTERGVATMFVAGSHWTVTPGIGLWIPAGIEHEGQTRDRTAVRATYFATAGWGPAWQRPQAVRLAPAVRELLIHLKHAHMSVEQRVRAQRVCVDLLEATDAVELDVPIPNDPRLAMLVEMILHDPADDRTLDQWASLLNMTTRTLTRVFAAEVALSFAQWRRLVRMRAALGHLARGMSVKAVAREVGYRTPSAFVTAFRRTVGTTPGEYAGRA
ncbi:helix-turn-helix transcriptional regulator [Leucobacter chromiireducens]|uniref:helix-turn-helix transcriptional regulator n=1 Tax=Leucobacter chromiireducens TaxID=283877 RepID=UPI000F6413D0|nr:AraC family transcriptional regulator [Leucobacter chromiireducens]